ncbi:transglutaminase, partial [Methylobacterium radiotolerans]
MGAGLLRTVRGMLVGAATLLSLAAPAQAQTLASLPTEAGAKVLGDAKPI